MFFINWLLQKAGLMNLIKSKVMLKFISALAHKNKPLFVDGFADFAKTIVLKYLDKLHQLSRFDHLRAINDADRVGFDMFFTIIYRKSKSRDQSSQSFFISLSSASSSSSSFFRLSSISLYFSIASFNSAAFLMRLIDFMSFIFYFCIDISSFWRFSFMRVARTGSCYICFQNNLQIVLSLTINQLLQKLTIQMDQKVRMLPHLNAYFLQRKAYEQHRKKIESIRSSGVRSAIKNTENNSPEKAEDNAEGKEVKAAIKYSIHTIKEEIKNQLTHKLSPWAKRQRKEHQKQNSRLINRIQKCESTISRKDILRHRLKNEEIKQRISKFVKSPRSHKTLMKCKHSLEVLRQKDRSREQSSIILNRNLYRQTQTKSSLSNIQRYSGSQRLPTQPLMFEKKASLDKFYLLKNRNKIMSHFQKKKSQPNMSVMRNYYSSVIESHKYLRGLGRSNRGKCFTTEIES